MKLREKTEEIIRLKREVAQLKEQMQKIKPT
jgi:hypothetical protein